MHTCVGGAISGQGSAGDSGQTEALPDGTVRWLCPPCPSLKSPCGVWDLKSQVGGKLRLETLGNERVARSGYAESQDESLGALASTTLALASSRLF